jgi:hypothetical protein
MCLKFSCMKSRLRIVSCTLILCFCFSCAGRKAQFFVFPENQQVFHNQNVIRNTFPGWDIDVSIMSPQDDYWYNKSAYASDYSYYLTLLSVYRRDSISVWNLESRGWRSLQTPQITEKIVVDSVRITFLPGSKSLVLYIDSNLFKEFPQYYIPGLHYKFKGFHVPKNTDSLRLQFQAILTDQYFSPLDSISLDTILCRWVRPEKNN